MNMRFFFGQLRHSPILRLAAVMLIALAWNSLAFGDEIHDAARGGDLTQVQALLKDNPDLVFSKDQDGETPLHLAAFNGHKEVMQLLLANKADVNAKDNSGRTALHMAAFNGHKEAVELLLANKAYVNAQANIGFTALDDAVTSGHFDVAELLLQHGAKANSLPTLPVPAISEQPSGSDSNGHKQVAALTDSQIQAAIQRGIDDRAGERFHFAMGNGIVNHAPAIEILRLSKIDFGKFRNFGQLIIALSDSDRIALAASAAAHHVSKHGVRSRNHDFSFSVQDAKDSAVKLGVITVIWRATGTVGQVGGWVGPANLDTMMSGRVGEAGNGLRLWLNADGRIIEPLTNGQYFAEPSVLRLSPSLKVWDWRDYFEFECNQPNYARCFETSFVFPVIEGARKLTVISVGANGQRVEKEVDPKIFEAR